MLRDVAAATIHGCPFGAHADEHGPAEGGLVAVDEWAVLEMLLLRRRQARCPVIFAIANEAFEGTNFGHDDGEND